MFKVRIQDGTETGHVFVGAGLEPQRIALNLPRPEAPLPQAGAGGSPPDLPCAALRRENDAKLRSFFRRCPNARRLYDDVSGEEAFALAHPQLTHLTPEDVERMKSADCKELEGGYVGLRIRNIQVPTDECHPDCRDESCMESVSSFQIKKTLVISTGGARIEIGKQRVKQATAASHRAGFDLEDLADSFESPDDSRHLKLRSAFDFDGDGTPEIITSQEIKEDCEAGYSIIRIWKVQDRALVPYSHAPSAAIADVKDVDHDGRPDLISRGAYKEASDTCVVDGDLGPPVFVHHSLPDGRFSEDHEVARTALRAHCPKLPLIPAWSPEGRAESQELSQSLICARAWKVSAAELLEKLAKQCRTWSAEQSACEKEALKSRVCPSWIKQLIEVKPRVQLP